MAARQQEELPRADREKPSPPQLHGVIGDQVIHLLGQPDGFHRIQVRKLWDDHYRVNVLVGEDVISASIAQSYFLVTDAAGTIIAATPKITRQY